MTLQEIPLEELHLRLFKLERENRRLKQLGVAALIVAASLVVMGQASQKKTVEASEFILRDTGGNIRARLSMDEKLSDAQLVLFDKEGKEKVKVDTGSDVLHFGGEVNLSDEHGLPRVHVGSDSFSGGVLSLLNQQGSPGTVLRTDSGNLPNVTIQQVITPQIILEGKDEKFRGMLGVNALTFEGEDGTFLTVGPEAIGFADSGKIVRAAFGPNGLQLIDAQGFEAQLGVTDLVVPRTGETHKTSAASLVLFDKNKNVIWKAP